MIKYKCIAKVSNLTVGNVYVDSSPYPNAFNAVVTDDNGDIDVLAIKGVLEVIGSVENDKLLTSSELWGQQAPSFNFELNEEELLALALEKGFVTDEGNGLYKMNEDY